MLTRQRGHAAARPGTRRRYYVLWCWPLIVVCLCWQPRFARAELSRTRSGTALHWSVNEIVLIQVDRGVENSVIPATALHESLEAGVAAWNRATSSCRVPRLVLASRRETRSWHRQDGRNLVSVVTQGDCRVDSDAPDLCGDPHTAARTALYPISAPGTPRDGLVQEADIELNAARFRWASDDAPSTAHLHRAILHELGHVLGLSHPCSFTVTGRRSCKDELYTNALMNPEAAVLHGPVALTPGAAEVNELCELYGRKPKASVPSARHTRSMHMEFAKLFLIVLALGLPLTILRRY